MPSKYGNRKTTLNGVEFDSHKEAQRYAQLRLLERAGRITNLRCQVKYILIPAQRDEKGKLLERECSYVADFVYFDLTLGREVVEDAKGYRTDTFKLKKKMMLWFHGIQITET
jgi:hypothetical protein